MGNSWKNKNLSKEQHATLYGFGAVSPWYWHEVVKIQAARIREWQREMVELISELEQGDTGLLDRFELAQHVQITIPHRIGIDAHLMIYAADHALETCRRYQSLSDNRPEISRAVTEFRKTVGDVGGLRNMLAHIHDYAIGTGNWGRDDNQYDGPHVDFDDPRDPTGEVTFKYGDHVVALFKLDAALDSLVGVVVKFY